MVSYCDVVRDGRTYTADEYLEFHRQLAHDIKCDLVSNRNANVDQT